MPLGFHASVGLQGKSAFRAWTGAGSRMKAGLSSAISLAAALTTRGGAALGGILLSLLVARLSGPTGLGQFAVFLSLLGGGAILARRGLDMLLIRAVAKAGMRAAPGVRLGLLWHGLRLAIVPALGVAALGAGLLATGALGEPMPGVVPAFLASLPMMTALALVSGYEKGRRRNWIAPMFEIGGISFVACILLAAAIGLGVEPRGAALPGVLTAATALTCVLAAIVIRREAGSPDAMRRPAPLADHQRAELSRGQTDFTLIALAAFLVKSGAFVIVAPFLSEDELGLVRAAERLALLVAFPALAINPFLAPRIVRHFQNAAPGNLWMLVRKAWAAGLVVALPATLAMIVYPAELLALFGDGFAPAAPYLRALAGVNLIVLLLAPFSVVLNMSGGERQMVWLSVWFTAASLLAFPLSSALLGADGFIIVYGSLAVLRSVAIFHYGRKKMAELPQDAEAGHAR